MNLYLDFLPNMVSDRRRDRRAGGRRAARAVARDDVAAAIAALLTCEGHDGKTLRHHRRRGAVDAPRWPRCRRASYSDETLEEAWASRAQYGAPDWQVEAWISTYQAIATGELERVSDDVRRFTGREPVTVAEFLRAPG